MFFSGLFSFLAVVLAAYLFHSVEQLLMLIAWTVLLEAEFLLGL
jgi:hypothetical protein